MEVSSAIFGCVDQSVSEVAFKTVLVKILFEAVYDFLDTSVLDENVIDTLLVLWPAGLFIDIEFIFCATGGNCWFALFALSEVVVFDAVVSEGIWCFETNALSVGLSDQHIAWFFSARGGDSGGTSVDLEYFVHFAFGAQPSAVTCRRSVRVRFHTPVVHLFLATFNHGDTVGGI